MHLMKHAWDKGSWLPWANTLELIDQYEVRVTHPAQCEYIDTSCSIPLRRRKGEVVNDYILPDTRPLINNQNVSRQVFYYSYLQQRWAGRRRTQMKRYPSKLTHTHTPLPPAAPPPTNTATQRDRECIIAISGESPPLPHSSHISKTNETDKAAPGPFRGERRLKPRPAQRRKDSGLCECPLISLGRAVWTHWMMWKWWWSAVWAAPLHTLRGSSGARGGDTGRRDQADARTIKPPRLQAAACRRSR